MICNAVEQCMKYSEEAAISWQDYMIDCVRSSAGCLQQFSDKSEISFSAGTLQVFTARNAFKFFEDY